MVVTELPIIALVRLVQFLNALSSIVITESGMIILSRLEQFINALYSKEFFG